MKRLNRFSKKEKGITLVALIITIVVLLILALVTINAVRGDGIIGKAQQAREEYEKKSDEENTTLDGYLAKIEENIPGNNTENQSLIGKILEENRTINGETYSSTNPIIPAGFMAINTDTSKWDVDSGPEVDNGLVISDGTNEFVWVPVTTTIAAYGLGTRSAREPDVVTNVYPSEKVDSASGTRYDAEEANLTLAGCTEDLNGDNTVNAYDFKIQLEKEFEAMKTSVNKYGGFYVGRYEMSLSGDKTAQSKYGEKSSTAEDANTRTWYGLYAKAKTYLNEKGSVQSSMIWGSQYDAMMNRIGEAANIKIGDNRNMREDRKTGFVETDKTKNVYDLYGNYFEWTLKALESGYRVVSGGSYYLDVVLSDYSYNYTNNAFSGYSSRLTLYIV